MNNIDTNISLGEIVKAFPGTVPTFNKYKLDYCCGGKDTLKTAAEALQLNADSILNEINIIITESGTSKNKDIDWDKESTGSIIDYILNKHHVFMKEALAELNFLMFKILKVHFKTEGETLLQVHKLFGDLKTEMEAHLVKEEENLFPMIIEYERSKNPELKNKISSYIKETESEHDTAGDVFKELEKVTNDYTAPEDACPTYIRTYKLLDALEKDTFNHIHLENTILFGRF